MSRRKRFTPAARVSAAPAVFPTADQIAAKAHDLFVAGGRRLTDLPDHWRRAEQELLDTAARRALASTASPTIQAEK